MVVTHKLTMDLEGNAQTPWIEVEQWDAYTREIRLLLVSRKIPWHIPEDAKVLICYRKPDGSSGVYDTLPDGKTAWSVLGNMLTMVLAPQILTVPGTVVLQAQIIQTEKILHTFQIEVCVRAHLGSSKNDEASGNHYALTGVLPAPSHAKIGQYIKVQDVNERGQIIRVDAADMIDEEQVQEIVSAYLQTNPPTNGNPGADGVGITMITIMEV